MNPSGRKRCLLALLLLPLAIGACSTTPPTPENPYAAEFARALADAPNEYQRGILADGVVARAELLDAQAHVVDCINASGLGVSAKYIEDDFGLSSLDSWVNGTFTDEQTGVVAACDTEWMGAIEGLYWGSVTNPNKEDWDVLVAECLVRHGLVAPGFTGEEYARLKAEHAAMYAKTLTPPEGYSELGSDSGEFHGTIRISEEDGWTCEGWCGVTPPLVFPGGTSEDDPEVRGCIVVPLR
ncbi:MAG: hypothetical protein LBC29_04215 [Propionibacteriaceae bacterium]|jgi:hypothetical protein|nr:hypothetical protein [Propionibacteriaceae bacterium]